MGWIINHDGSKAIKCNLVEMFFIEYDAEAPEETKYAVVARNKDFKSYLFYSSSEKQCLKKMKFIIDKLDDWEIDMRDAT